MKPQNYSFAAVIETPVTLGRRTRGWRQADHRVRGPFISWNKRGSAGFKWKPFSCRGGKHREVALSPFLEGYQLPQDVSLSNLVWPHVQACSGQGIGLETSCDPNWSELSSVPVVPKLRNSLQSKEFFLFSWWRETQKSKKMSLSVDISRKSSFKKIQNAKLKTWILVKNICQTLKGHKCLSWVQICPTSASVIKSGLPKCQNHKTHPRKSSCTSSYKRASQLWHWKYWLCCLIGKRITTISSILSFFIPFILNYTKL